MKTITLEVTDERYEELLKESTLPTINRFVPEIGKEYWYCDDVGEEDYDKWENDDMDLFRLGQNNVFRTRAEAQKHSAKLHAISEVTNYCYENDLVCEDYWTADESPRGYEIFYNKTTKDFDDCPSSHLYLTIIPHLKSSEACNQVIKEKEEALKLIFEI